MLINTVYHTTCAMELTVNVWRNGKTGPPASRVSKWLHHITVTSISRYLKVKSQKKIAVKMGEPSPKWRAFRLDLGSFTVDMYCNSLLPTKKYPKDSLSTILLCSFQAFSSGRTSCWLLLRFESSQRGWRGAEFGHSWIIHAGFKPDVPCKPLNILNIFLELSQTGQYWSTKLT